MTRRLYLQDSFLQSCETTVTFCQPGPKGGFLVGLAETVFFPESGGQPSDRGIISNAVVTHVSEKGGEVFHHCDRPVEVGSRVAAAIDFRRRFDMMQQHSGEHIIACAAYRLFRANNVGFHLGEENLGLDLDYQLTPSQADLLEETANSYISAGLPITARILTDEEYHALPMRKKAENLKGEIRLVTVGELDYATCCGTHCTLTSQVELVKILSCENYKGGSRLELACGGRALADYRYKNAFVNALGRRFSVPAVKAEAAFARYEEENAQLRRELRQRSSLLIGLKADQLLEGWQGQPVCCRWDDLNPEECRELLNLLCKREGMVTVLWNAKNGRVNYLVGCGENAPLTAKAVCTRINGELGGRGGGNALLAQGSAPSGEGWEACADQLESWLRGELSRQ